MINSYKEDVAHACDVSVWHRQSAFTHSEYNSLNFGSIVKTPIIILKYNIILEGKTMIFFPLFPL